ncbi:MAG: GtrA family protein [Defluviitaleaceae bacterium]|nr:GtrA family protein [Defluviitaleaceae bacterium]
MRALYEKHRQVVLYIIFGGATTAVNFIFYVAASFGLGLDAWLSTAVAWVFAVIFAFATNKIYVFESKVRSKGGVAKEFSLFIGARIASGVINAVLMYVFVDRLSFNELLLFALCQIFVIVFNYVASKWFIFK